MIAAIKTYSDKRKNVELGKDESPKIGGVFLKKIESIKKLPNIAPSDINNVISSTFGIRESNREKKNTLPILT